jgi:hypothetical protein
LNIKPRQAAACFDARQSVCRWLSETREKQGKDRGLG